MLYSRILKTNNFEGSSFCSKYSKFYLDSGNPEKKSENILWFCDNSIWIGCLKHSLSLRAKLVIGCQYVNKESQDLRYYWTGIFGGNFLSEWSKNMTNRLPCRFKQSFGPFNMFTVHTCSDTALFGHLSNPSFCGL